MITTQKVNKFVNLDSHFRGNDIRDSTNNLRNNVNDIGSKDNEIFIIESHNLL